MAKRAPLTLDAMKAAKAPSPAAPAVPNRFENEEATNRLADNRRGQTLRLNSDAWRELKYLAVDHGCTAHHLLIEAVNDLLVKHGRPPVA